MKTLRAGNRTVLNQQCEEGNTTIEERLQGINPPQVQCVNCRIILFCKVCLELKDFLCKEIERTQNIFTRSLTLQIVNCQKYIFGWDRVDIFHLWRRPKIEHARARANKHVQQRCACMQTKKQVMKGFSQCVCVGDITTYILFLVLSISAYSHATDSITNSISFWYYIYIYIYIYRQ